MAGFTLSACHSIFRIDPEPPFAHCGCRRKSQGEEDEAATHPRPVAFSCMITSLREACPSARKISFRRLGRSNGCAGRVARRAADLIGPNPAGVGLCGAEDQANMPGLWSRPGGAMKAPCGILWLSGLRPPMITARHWSLAVGCQALAGLLPQILGDAQ